MDDVPEMAVLRCYLHLMRNLKSRVDHLDKPSRIMRCGLHLSRPRFDFIVQPHPILMCREKMASAYVFQDAHMTSE